MIARKQNEQGKPVIALDSGKVLIDYDHSILIHRLSELAGKEIGSEVLSQMEEIVASMQIGQLPWNRAVAMMNRAIGLKMEETDWRHLYNDMIQDEIPGMREVLSDLKENYRLVVLSNTDEIHWTYLLNNFPIYKLLDGWVVSYQEKRAKPDPDIYRILMERFCGGRVPVFFTDDMPAYVAAAHKMGWRAEAFVDADRFREQIKRLRI